MKTSLKDEGKIQNFRQTKTKKIHCYRICSGRSTDKGSFSEWSEMVSDSNLKAHTQTHEEHWKW